MLLRTIVGCIAITTMLSGCSTSEMTAEDFASQPTGVSSAQSKALEEMTVEERAMQSTGDPVFDQRYKELIQKLDKFDRMYKKQFPDAEGS